MNETSNQPEKLTSAPSPAPNTELKDIRLAFLGRLASMSSKEAAALVRLHGATVSKIIDHRLNLIVLGEDPTVKVQSEAWLSQPIAEAIDRGTLEIITETVLWQRLGWLVYSLDGSCEEKNVSPLECSGSPDTVDLSKLFTTSMIASLLDLPVAVIRLWQKKGLIRPVRQIGRLSYFELKEVASAKTLAHLVESGVSPPLLEKKIRQLAKFIPTANLSLDQMSISVSGNQILFRQDNQLLDANGQTYFDFETAENNPSHQQASDDMVSDSDSELELEPMEESVDYFDDLKNRIGWDSPDNVQQNWSNDRFREQITWLTEARQLNNALSLSRIMAMQYGLTADDCVLMGEILYRLGEKQAARERFFSAVEMDENHLDAKMQLGCVLVEQQQYLLAEALFDGCLKIQPDFPDAHFHLAALLDLLDRPDEADEHWRRFRFLVPDSPWRKIASQRLGIIEG